MKKVIYCFSGTGNSLNAARIIAKEMGGAKILRLAALAQDDSLVHEHFVVRAY